MHRFNLRYFLLYKLLNSLFVGLSIGIFFTLYEPLKPIVYSVGGILLALGIMLVAQLYKKILNYTYFFRVSLFIELLMVFMLLIVLVFQFSLFTAVAVYSGYQLGFVFGSYVLRVESLVLKRAALLAQVDSAKQIGYIIGLVLSYGFYAYFYTWDKHTQVYNLHYILALLQAGVVLSLLKGFKKI